MKCFKGRFITAFRNKAQGDLIAFFIGSVDFDNRTVGQAFFSGVILAFFPGGPVNKERRRLMRGIAETDRREI